MAVLLPAVGLLMGLALVAQGDDDGPWVVGMALFANAIYVVAVVVALS